MSGAVLRHLFALGHPQPCNQTGGGPPHHHPAHQHRFRRQRDRRRGYSAPFRLDRPVRGPAQCLWWPAGKHHRWRERQPLSDQRGFDWRATDRLALKFDIENDRRNGEERGGITTPTAINGRITLPSVPNPANRYAPAGSLFVSGARSVVPEQPCPRRTGWPGPYLGIHHELLFGYARNRQWTDDSHQAIFALLSHNLYTPITTDYSALRYTTTVVNSGTLRIDTGAYVLDMAHVTGKLMVIGARAMSIIALLPAARTLPCAPGCPRAGAP